MRLRVPLAVLSLAAGAVVGTASVLVHGGTLGLTVALVAALASVLALPPGWWARLPFALGWLGSVLYFSNPRPEGDYLVASDTGGYLLLASGMAIAAFGVITVRPVAASRGRRPSGAV
uniref:DUF6113 family protein n=1 Tax=Nocardioides sp. TaxID=35761 RepID=UPI002B268A7B